MARSKPDASVSAALAQPLVGTRLPDLTLPATTGGAVALASIAEPAVCYLYPYTGHPDVPDPPNWDVIPGAHGSTPQAVGFGQHYAAFLAAGYVVYGISGQSPSWQREFATRKALPFALLSDDALALADGLALPTFATGGVRYYERLTLIVRAGLIAHVIHPVLDPAGHAADLLAGGWIG